MKTVAEYLTSAHEGLGQFEAALRGGIVNQNIADIVASARAKLAQAASHPDGEIELASLEQKPDTPPLQSIDDTPATDPNVPLPFPYGKNIPTGE